MIAFDDAQMALLAACRPLENEVVSFGDALHRVTAARLVAREDLVPFARSAMDGFAVRGCDTHIPGRLLPIHGSAFSGTGRLILMPGTAIAIATGAPLPDGADAVIPSEDVIIDGQAVRIIQAADVGSSVFPPGDDARCGDTIVDRGIRIGPATLGMLAAAGLDPIPVVRQPRVTVITSGDEVVPLTATPEFGQIRNSNAPVIAATLRAAGAAICAVVHVPDQRSVVIDALQKAFDESDLVVTSGGASVGERDFVKSACDELGVDFAYRSIAMRPCKPFAFGTRGNSRIAVLPGNPAATFVALHTLVRPGVERLAGLDDVRPPRLNVRLRGELRAKSGRLFFAFGALVMCADGLWAVPLENQCSSLTRTMADAAGFIVVPPGDHTYRNGDDVAFDVVDWTALFIESSASIARHSGPSLRSRSLA